MANIKISELTELEQVDNDDLLVIVDTSANETKKVKARNVGTGGGGSDVVIISDTEPTSEFNKLWINPEEVGENFSEITNEYSTSTGKGYSANYINNLNTYSTNEIRVGTWKNGKPLYRVDVEMSISANTSTTVKTISNLDYARVIGTITLSNGTILDISGYSNSSEYGHWWKSTNDIRYSHTNAGTIDVSIFYTKTTD